MAIVKFCDWLKMKIPQGERTFAVSVDGQKFEVSEHGKNAIIAQLEGDVPAILPREVSIARSDSQVVVQAPTPLQLPASDPFNPGTGSMPMTPQANQDIPDDERLRVPEDTTKPLPAPTVKQRERVIRESTVAEPGTLEVLSNPSARKEATRKLREGDSLADETYRSSHSGHGINIGAHERGR